ncbi:MAG: cytochrome c [Verrucomicrobia bacterium]|nr:cytochrome c [Verrucomicrobiota bacterium]
MSQKTKKPETESAETEPTIAAGGGSAWPFVLLVVLLFGCFLHVESTGGAFRADVFQAGMRTLPPQTDDPPAVKSYKRGAQLYAAGCVGCHQATGLGSAALNFPPLAGSEWVVREKPDRLIRIMLNAVEGPIKVKDITYDNPAMLAFRDVYSDDDIAAIATFIRGNAEWGNSAAFVTPQQVKAIRDGTAAMGSQKWRVESLEPVP